MEELIGILLSKLLDREIREGRHDYIVEAREKAEELEYHFENEYPDYAGFFRIRRLVSEGGNAK
jgi:hypothetical protein